MHIFPKKDSIRVSKQHQNEEYVRGRLAPLLQLTVFPLTEVTFSLRFKMLQLQSSHAFKSNPLSSVRLHHPGRNKNLAF